MGFDKFSGKNRKRTVILVLITSRKRATQKGWNQGEGWGRNTGW